MGDRVHDSTVEQRQPRDGKPGVDRVLVGAVAVEHRRSRAVEGDIGSSDDRQRDPGAVGCAGPTALLDVGVRPVRPEGRIVEHRAALQQGELGRGQVVVVHRVRGEHRSVVDPDGRRLVVRFTRRVDHIERLVELDVPARHQIPGGGPRQHVQPGEPVAPQRDHRMRPVRGDAEDPDPGLVAQHRSPVGMAAGAQRRLGELEVLGAVVVHDQQPIAGRFDVVLHALAPRCDAPRHARGVVDAEQPALRGDLAAGPEDQPALVAAGAHTEPEPLVRLGQHLDVLGRIGSQPVAEHHVRAPGLVGPGVEHVFVPRPGDPVGGVGDLLRQQFTGRQVLDRQGEPLGAGDVQRIGQQPPAGGHAEGADGEELLIARLDIAVEQHFLADDLLLGVRRRRPVRRPDPAVDPILRPLDGPGVVPVGRAVAVRREARHRQVGLLGPRLDLAEDRLGQRAEVGRLRVGVGILGLEVADDLGILLVPQPFVGITERVPVMGPLDRTAVRAGRGLVSGKTSSHGHGA